jgi:hypothetical protein
MAPSRSVRNNNPGNLRFSSFTEARGAVDGGGNYSKFPTVVQGVAAMVDLLAGGAYRRLEIGAAVEKYAPRSDNNDPAAYAKFICDRAGVSLDKRIDELNPFRFLRLVAAMIEREGWKE